MSHRFKAKARMRDAVAWVVAGAPLTLVHVVVFCGVTGIAEKLPPNGIMHTAFEAMKVTLLIATVASWPVWLLTVGLSRNDEAGFCQKVQAGLLLAGWAVIAVGLCIDALS